MSSPIKVITWNIRLGIQKGINEIIKLINHINPDLLFLQEVGRHWSMGATGDIPALIAHSCHFHCFDFSPSIDLENPLHRCLLPISLQNNTGQYGHALFARSPFSIQRLDWISLPRILDEPRTLLFSRMTLPQSDPILLISTHLSHVSDRTLQGDFLADTIEALRGRPLILAGDLNEPSNSSQPWFLKLSDLLEIAPLHSPTFPSDHPEHTIDYLMTNLGPWSEVDVLDSDGLSDHNLVVATVRPPR